MTRYAYARARPSSACAAPLVSAVVWPEAEPDLAELHRAVLIAEPVEIEELALGRARRVRDMFGRWR